MKPGTPVFSRHTVAGSVRERIRYKHYSLRTVQAYVQSVRMFVKWHVCGICETWGSRKLKVFWPSWLNDDFEASSWTAAQDQSQALTNDR